jgi:hypothetical protein
VAYFSDIEYIFDSEPGLIAVNAKEYQRVARLLEQVAGPELDALNGKLDWVGDGRKAFDAKFQEARVIVAGLRKAFAAAGKALEEYVPQIVAAKRLVDDGRQASYQLRQVIKPVYPISRDTPDRGEDPLRAYEKIRPVLVREAANPHPMAYRQAQAMIYQATPLYHRALESYSEAKRIEETARARCLPALRAAFRQVPNYALPHSKFSEWMIKSTPFLEHEMREAAADPRVRLPGSGPVPDLVDATHPGTGRVSPILADIRAAASTLPGGNVAWDWSDVERWRQQDAGKPVPGETADEFRQRWIHHNKDVIIAAAAKYGLPADFVAGVAMQELPGEPMSKDETVFLMRKFAPDAVLEHLDPRAAVPPEWTSMGAVDMQIRRAADALGYDATQLTWSQREEVAESLRDAKQNIFIVAKHLSDLKQSTDFPFAEQLTVAQMAELEARYTSGPYWRGDDAQGPVQSFLRGLPKARNAIQ